MHGEWFANTWWMSAVAEIFGECKASVRWINFPWRSPNTVFWLIHQAYRKHYVNRKLINRWGMLREWLLINRQAFAETFAKHSPKKIFLCKWGIRQAFAENIRRKLICMGNVNVRRMFGEQSLSIRAAFVERLDECSVRIHFRPTLAKRSLSIHWKHSPNPSRSVTLPKVGL